MRVPRSLVAATSIDVLAADHVVERREDHWVVRSPSHPDFWWGNLLLFDEAPQEGDGERWEAAFARAFPATSHRTFSWDVVDGALGSADGEFVARGYELERNVGLIAKAHELRPHPRASSDVTVRPLDPRGDDALWDAVVEVQVAGRDVEHFDEHTWRSFSRQRLGDLRALFLAGRGTEYVAIDGNGSLAAICGIVVTEGRARYQAVETVEAWRRRGVASRLLIDAGAHAARAFGARELVIVADADYHALALYESLGFRPREHTSGVLRRSV